MNIKFIYFKNTLIAFSFFFTLNIMSSPIVDIEGVRKSDQIGKFRNIGFGFSGSRGNEDRNDYDISLSLVNNSEKYERLFVFEKSERTKDDVAEDESTFLHARLLRQLNNKSYDLETYFQISENPFQSYKTTDKEFHYLLTIIYFYKCDSLKMHQEVKHFLNFYKMSCFIFCSTSNEIL